MNAALVSRLWSRAREALALMAMALGDPQAIMNLCWPSRRERREILSWLAPLEVLARKLLLIHASTLAPIPPRTHTPAPPPAPVREAKAIAPLRATFRVLKPRRKAPQLKHLPRINIFMQRPPPPPLRWRKRGRLSPAVRLALRYQALIDVLERPGPAARRLARKLRANACLAYMLAVSACPVEPGYFWHDLRAATRHAEIAAVR